MTGRRPRLLDLFCGAGGAAMGYHRVGFDVVGVDLRPQPNYPFEFHQADALTVSARGFDAVHASPPCQAYSRAAVARKKPGHAELLDPVRELLLESGLPWVIENVPDAPLRNPHTLCGTAFGLPIIRHRSFESSFAITGGGCGYAPTASVRHAGYVAYPYARKSWQPAWREHVLPVVWPWMTLTEAGQAIPPEYTEHIGRQMLTELGVEAIAA